MNIIKGQILNIFTISVYIMHYPAGPHLAPSADHTYCDEV